MGWWHHILFIITVVVLVGGVPCEENPKKTLKQGLFAVENLGEKRGKTDVVVHAFLFIKVLHNPSTKRFHRMWKVLAPNSGFQTFHRFQKIGIFLHHRFDLLASGDDRGVVAPIEQRRDPFVWQTQQRVTEIHADLSR